MSIAFTSVLLSQLLNSEFTISISPVGLSIYIAEVDTIGACIFAFKVLLIN